MHVCMYGNVQSSPQGNSLQSLPVLITVGLESRWNCLDDDDWSFF